VTAHAGLELVELEDRLVDLRAHGNEGLDSLASHHLEFREQGQIPRVHGCHLEFVVSHADRQNGVFPRVRLGDKRQRLFLHPGARKIDLRDFEMLAQHPGQRGFVDQPLRKQHLAER
jgi:hypothetical protein